MAFLAPLAAPLAIGGAGISAIGAIEQGQATANAASYSAQVARNNATVAEQNAQYSTEAGQARAEASSRKGAASLGKLKASQAASGVDVNSGSAVNVQESERETNKLDTETVLNNAELQAYGYRSQATSFNAQAGLKDEEAKQAPIGAGFAAAGGLLSSASSIGMKWSGLPTAATPDPGVATFNSGGQVY